MKKYLALALALMLAFALAACGGNGGDTPTDPVNPISGTTANSSSAPQITELYFEYNGLRMEIGMEPTQLLADLGEPEETKETKSCALNAKDVNYYYPSIRLTVTYPESGDPYLTNIKLEDDAVATPGNIKVQTSTLAEVIAAYGTDYKETSGAYTYTQGDGQLEFMIQNDLVIQIKYNYIFN